MLEQAVKAGVKSITIKFYPIDLQGDAEDVRAALRKVESDLGPPEVLLYNASKLEPSVMFDYQEKSMEESYRVCIHSVSAISNLSQPTFDRV